MRSSLPCIPRILSVKPILLELTLCSRVAIQPAGSRPLSVLQAVRFTPTPNCGRVRAFRHIVPLRTLRTRLFAIASKLSSATGKAGYELAGHCDALGHRCRRCCGRIAHFARKWRSKSLRCRRIGLSIQVVFVYGLRKIPRSALLVQVSTGVCWSSGRPS
jgi:hypothetical protein